MNNKNLLFIVVDQLRYDAIAYNGNKIIKTPNIDKLAQSGISMDNFYTNSPVCIPGRCNLFTGRLPHSHQVRENHTMLEAGREIHLFRALKHANYDLGYFGKNHLLEHIEFSNFDAIDVEEHNHKDTEEGYLKYKKICQEKMNSNGTWGGIAYYDFPQEETPAHAFTTSACNFMNEDREKPFCACLSILEPHAPHMAPIEIGEMYKNAVDTIPESSEEELKEKASRWYLKYLAQKGDKATDEDKKNFIKMYYSMVTFVDNEIGRALKSLEESGKANDTLVVMTCDHGEFLMDHGMSKKDLVLCNSLLHVPMFMSCPSMLPSGKRYTSLAEQIDVMPTILELLDVKIPYGVQGKSFAKYIKGEVDTHKNATYSEICPPWLFNPFKDFEQLSHYWLDEIGASTVSFNIPGDYTKSVRTNEYRYVWYGTGEEELYDMVNDFAERKNLAKDPAYKEKLLELKLQLFTWYALSEDPIDSMFSDILQYEYPNWISAKKIENPKLYGPYWIDYRKSFTLDDKNLY